MGKGGEEEEINIGTNIYIYINKEGEISKENISIKMAIKDLLLILMIKW